MQSADQQVLATAQAWADQGHDFALITVARTWGSSPRPEGAWMILRDDGQVAGSVSGGCIEDDLVHRMKTGALLAARPYALTYGVTSDEAQRHGLPCGGTLELVVEPHADVASLRAIAACLANRQACRREVDLDSGTVSIHPAVTQEHVHWDGQRLSTPHGPVWRLLIIGASQLGRFLANMALALDYEVTVCDPRPHYAQAWDLAEVPLVRSMPDDTVLAMQPDARTVIVAVTHDPKLDDMALLEALRSEAFYVGALGSQKSNDKRRQRLAEHFDFTDAELARLHGPVGLRLGSRTPAEIAVAILAELVALRRQADHSPAARLAQAA